MKKNFFIFLSFFLILATVSKTEAKKRKKYFSRKWSISFVNGYSFHHKENKSNTKDPHTLTDWEDGQTQIFFSAIELSRNFGHFEAGAKIQNTKHTFISPFIKWNLNKNSSRAKIIPSFTLGFTPSILMGSWVRASIGLSVNRSMSIEPFFGAYAWRKIKDHANYIKSNWHLNTGLRINLYY